MYIENIYELIKKLDYKYCNMIVKGYVSRETQHPDSTYPRAQIRLRGNLVYDDATQLEPYGIFGVPPTNTRQITYYPSAYSTDPYFIPYEIENRFKGAKVGEVGIYHPKTQSILHFKDDGSIEIEAKANLKITVAGDVNITVNGNVELKADNVNIDAAQTNLGTGGKKIALHDDPIVDDKIVASGINTSI